MRRPAIRAVFLAAIVATAAAPAGATEPKIDEGILGDWEAKPFTWRTGEVKGCRYRQIITIRQRVAPGKFTGTYKARTTCTSKAWNLRGNITVTVTGHDVRIDADTKHWIVERVRYINSYRMEGKDAQGHPMIYVRPKGKPIS